MNRLLALLILMTVLVGCGAPAQAPSAALHTPAPAYPVLVLTTPNLTLTPSSTPSSTPSPSASIQPAAGTASAANLLSSDPTSLPTALQSLVWHGVRFHYDPHRYQFSETTPYARDPLPWATASLSYTTDPCLPDMADCPPAAAFLALYSRGGLDFWTWLAQQTIIHSYDPEGDFSAYVVAGQPAAYWAAEGLGGPEIAVSVGADVLLISGVEAAEVTTLIELEHPDEIALAVGHIAMTTPTRTWTLWSTATGGVRVAERPQLYNGAFVTILAIEPQAVQVRTSEGVIGWIHAAATEALSSQLVVLGDYPPIRCVFRARVIQGYAIPLREGPRSTAGQRGDLLTSDQEVMVVSVRGDWLRVYTSAASGWIRWYYDGVQYVDTANNPRC